METKVFGRTGPRVTEIGMGTYYDTPWMFTGMLGWRRGNDDRVDALKSGLAAGINLIDTAEAYKSEPIVRAAIEGQRREAVFVATKVTPTHLRYSSVRKALEGSLRRLGTPYVDLYQIHYPNPLIPLEGTMKAMGELLDERKIRAVGVSNFSLEQMERANSLLKKGTLAATQMEYSLANRSIEKKIIPYCRQEGISVLAYRPLGHGKLAAGGSALGKICAKHSKTPAQVALRWLCEQPGVFPIPRASNRNHVSEDIGATGWRLDEEDLRELDRAFPPPA